MPKKKSTRQSHTKNIKFSSFTTFNNEGQTVWLAWLLEDNPGIRYESGSSFRRATSDNTWASGMPKWFGYYAYLSYKYSIYANYTPTGVLGNNERFDGTNDNYDRRAAIYEVPEDGEIHSISIFHEGGSGDMLLAVYSDDNNEPDQRLAVTASTPIKSNAGWQTSRIYPKQLHDPP